MQGSDHGIQEEEGTEATTRRYKVSGTFIPEREGVGCQCGVYPQKEDAAVYRGCQGHEGICQWLFSVDRIFVDTVADSIYRHFGHGGIAYSYYPLGGVEQGEVYVKVCTKCLIAQFCFILTGSHAYERGAGEQYLV